MVGLVLLLSAESSIDRNIAAIHRLGVPTSYEELEKLGPQSGEDAADLYGKHAFVKLTPSQIAAEDVLTATSHSMLAEKKAAANELRPTFDWLIKGAHMPRWTIEPDRPWRNLDKLPSFITVSLRVSQKVGTLSHIATIDYQTGSRKLALEEFHDIILVSNQRQEPDLLQQIMARNDEERAIAPMIHLVQEQQNNPSVLSDATALFKSLPPLPDIRLGLFADFVQQCDVEQTIKLYRSSPHDDHPTIMDRIRNEIDQRKFELDFVIWKQAFEELQRTPHWGWQQVHDVFTALDRRYSSSLFYSGLAKDLAHLADTWGRWIADLRVRRACLRLLQERLKSGSLAKTLPDFGEDSIDPFTGQPLCYKVHGKGFMVYSVGPDRHDDGGLPRTTENAPYDIVINMDSKT